METATATAPKKAPPMRKVSAKASAPVKKKAPVIKKKASKKETDENLVTMKMLAKEHKLAPNVVRRKLRSAGLKTDGRWSWTKGSGDLKKATAVLVGDKE